VCASCVPVSGQEVNYGPESRADYSREQSTCQTILGPFREAQRFLNLRLQQRDNGRVSRAAVPSPNHLLGQWLSTVVKGRVRVRNVAGLPNETTERYLEIEQDFVSAVNDNLGLER
jgi:hypothetical protein